MKIMLRQISVNRHRIKSNSLAMSQRGALKAFLNDQALAGGIMAGQVEDDKISDISDGRFAKNKQLKLPGNRLDISRQLEQDADDPPHKPDPQFPPNFLA